MYCLFLQPNVILCVELCVGVVSSVLCGIVLYVVLSCVLCSVVLCCAVLCGEFSCALDWRWISNDNKSLNINQIIELQPKVYGRYSYQLNKWNHRSGEIGIEGMETKKMKPMGEVSFDFVESIIQNQSVYQRVSQSVSQSVSVSVSQSACQSVSQSASLSVSLLIILPVTWYQHNTNAVYVRN